MVTMDLSGDEIADVVLKTFDALPAKRKPQVRTNGVREWVPMSGIVAEGKSIGLRCISLATGMKCLPATKIPQAQGLMLHDSHAEVLAIRSFNRFLLEECHSLALSPDNFSSEYIIRRPDEQVTASLFQPFALKDDIKLHMYCSKAPCGDASMELIMAAQTDATPWDPPPEPPLSTSPSSSTPTFLGRGHFSSLGTVRRKPSRPDAPPTLSKSCTDKLALKQATSLLSSLSSLLISPSNVYLSSLVLPTSQYVPKACERAFGQGPEGRMRSLRDKIWENGGYSFKPFSVLTTSKHFAYTIPTPSNSPSASRASSPQPDAQGIPPTPGLTLVPSPLSITTQYPHTDSASCKSTEATTNGLVQGYKHAHVFGPRRPIRGASRLCKRRMWKLALDIATLAAASSAAATVPRIRRVLEAENYRDVKECDLLEGRWTVKKETRETALKGWVRNEADGEAFLLEGIES